MGNMMRKQWNWELARMDFPGTWKEETKEPMFSYKQFSDVVVFFSLIDIRIIRRPDWRTRELSRSQQK